MIWHLCLLFTGHHQGVTHLEKLNFLCNNENHWHPNKIPEIHLDITEWTIFFFWTYRPAYKKLPWFIQNLWTVKVAQLPPVAGQNSLPSPSVRFCPKLPVFQPPVLKHGLLLYLTHTWHSLYAPSCQSEFLVCANLRFMLLNCLIVSCLTTCCYGSSLCTLRIDSPHI